MSQYRPPPVVIRTQVPPLVLVVFTVALVVRVFHLLLLGGLAGKGGVVARGKCVDVANVGLREDLVVYVGWEGVTAQPETHVAGDRRLEQLRLEGVDAFEQFCRIAPLWRGRYLHLKRMMSR